MEADSSQFFAFDVEKKTHTEQNKKHMSMLFFGREIVLAYILCRLLFRGYCNFSRCSLQTLSDVSLIWVSVLYFLFMNTNKWILVMLNKLYNKRWKCFVDPHMIDIHGLFGLLVLYYFQLTYPSPIYLKFYCRLFPCLSLSLVYTHFSCFIVPKEIFLLRHSPWPILYVSSLVMILIIASLSVSSTFIFLFVECLVVYTFTCIGLTVCISTVICLTVCISTYCHMSNCLYFYCQMPHCLYTPIFICLSIFQLSNVSLSILQRL